MSPMIEVKRKPRPAIGTSGGDEYEWDRLFETAVHNAVDNLFDEFLHACSLRNEFDDLIEYYREYLEQELEVAAPTVAHPRSDTPEDERDAVFKEVDDRDRMIAATLQSTIDEICTNLLVKRAFALSVAERIVERLNRAYPDMFDLSH